MTNQSTTQSSESCFTYIDPKDLIITGPTEVFAPEFKVPMPLMLLAACFGIG